MRVYAVGPGNGGECVHELVGTSGNKFHSCTFHPKYPSLLVIGCYQVRGNRSRAVLGVICCVSACACAGLPRSSSCSTAQKR